MNRVRKQCEWRMLTEFKPEQSEELGQIRDKLRQNYGVWLSPKEGANGQIFRCRYYFYKRNCAFRCPYKIRWDKEKGLLWETGQHQHMEKFKTVEQQNAVQQTIMATNKNAPQPKKQIGALSDEDHQQIYTGRLGAKYVFLAKIQDQAQLDRIRDTHRLSNWQYKKTKIHMRCKHFNTFPHCPYKGVYVKESRMLYHRFAHFHVKVKKKKKQTENEEDSTVEYQTRNTVVAEQQEATERTTNKLDLANDAKSSRKSYVDQYNGKWEFFANIDDEAHLSRFRLARGLSIRYNYKSQIGLRCSQHSNAMVPCPYRGLYLKAERILYYHGSHSHKVKKIGMVKSRSRMKPVMKIKKKKRNQQGKITMLSNGHEENSVTGDTVAEKQTPYIDNTGKKWQFLARIDDEADLAQVRLANGLSPRAYVANKIRLRCTQAPTFPSCLYRGIYVKAEKTLYHRGTHYHDKNIKRIRNNTVAVKGKNVSMNNTVAKQPLQEDAEGTATEQTTHENGEDTVALQLAKGDAKDTVAEQPINEDGESTVAEQPAEEDGKNNVAGQTMNEDSVIEQPTKQQIKKYGNGSKENWALLAKIGDEADFAIIRKAHGLKIWLYGPGKIRLRCSRDYTFPKCPYRGVYVEADRTLYHRGAHCHDQKAKKKPRKRKMNTVAGKIDENTAMKNASIVNTVPKKLLEEDREGTVVEQPMKKDNEGTVAEQPMTNDSKDAETDQPKSYIDRLGNQWKLLAKIEDEAHFKQLRLAQGFSLNRYNEKTIQLYCLSRLEKCGRCPYRGLYLRGPRLLYRRFAHNHPPKTEKKKNGKQGRKTTMKKKHNSREDQQKPNKAEEPINGINQRSGGSDQRSPCRKRKALSPVPGCSHSKKANCENDPFDDNANKDFVIADFKDEFKRVTEQPTLEFLEENGTFALAKMDLATRNVDKMLLFMDMGNSLVEVCKFEGDQFTGQREKWAITEPEQFRHEFHRICADYLV